MRYRSIRHRVRRKIQSTFELDITSLLDILVILLIFLLKSYNSSGVVFNIQEGIELPKSFSKKINTPGIIIQVAQTTILVDDKVIYDSKNRPPKIFDGYMNRRIIPLFNELTKKREEAMLMNRNVPNSKKFSGTINFVIDKSIGYNYIRKLVYTAAESGYFKYNFVVLGENF